MHRETRTPLCASISCEGKGEYDDLTVTVTSTASLSDGASAGVEVNVWAPLPRALPRFLLSPPSLPLGSSILCLPRQRPSKASFLDQVRTGTFSRRDTAVVMKCDAVLL